MKDILSRITGLRIVVGITLTAALLAFGALMIVRSLDRSNSAQDLGTQIQHERARSIRAACQDTNSRHVAVIKALDVLIAEISDPTLRRRAEVNRASTVLLLDALVPIRDCEQLVNQAVG